MKFYDITNKHKPAVCLINNKDGANSSIELLYAESPDNKDYPIQETYLFNDELELIIQCTEKTIGDIRNKVSSIEYDLDTLLEYESEIEKREFLCTKIRNILKYRKKVSDELDKLIDDSLKKANKNPYGMSIKLL